jgi:hypothetical protein
MDAGGRMIQAPHLREDPPVAVPVESLEERVQRLECLVATLQDARQMEERVADRVAEQVENRLRPAPPRATVMEMTRELLPAALESARLGTNGPETASGQSARSRASWLLLEFYDEVRAIFWMFLDTRYRMTWTCRLLPVSILVLILFGWFLLGSLPLVGALIDKLFDIVLIAIGYKVLSREAGRYRQMVPDFPPRRRA